MKTLKRIFLTLVIIIVVVVVGIFANQKIKQQRMVNAVKDDLLAIDQETHSWENNKIKMGLYIRNKSNCSIDGALVFLVTLSKKGLDKEFVKSYFGHTDDVYGEWCAAKKAKSFKSEIAKGTITGRDKALYDYSSRSFKFPKGMDYEPIILDDIKEDYTFKFREGVSLDSGEIEVVKHVQKVPPTVYGLLYNIKIEGIEF